MRGIHRGIAAALVAAAFSFLGCGEERCGPSEGVVAKAVDGDTIELESGERIRYLLVDTPESTTETECFGEQAKSYNRSLVEGQRVTLNYDTECRDRFNRLLAYVFLENVEVNRLMIERGYACVLHISPNGDDVVQDYESLEQKAKDDGRGLWGFCSTRPC